MKQRTLLQSKAAISKALTAAQKEAMGILPSQRSKALEMIRKIEIPKRRESAPCSLTQMLKALPICSIRSWALCKPFDDPERRRPWPRCAPGAQSAAAGSVISNVDPAFAR